MPLNPGRLKARRAEYRYSQRGLAVAAGLSYSTIDNMERGNVTEPKYSVIKAVAAVLGVDPDYFFDPIAVNNQEAS